MTWEWPDDSNRAREASERRRAEDLKRAERERNRVPRANEKTRRNAEIATAVARGKSVAYLAMVHHVSKGRVRKIAERERQRLEVIAGSGRP